MMGVRKNWVGSMALAGLAGLGIPWVPPAIAQSPRVADPLPEFASDLAPESPPQPGARVPPPNREGRSLRDFEVSVSLDKWELITEAAILPTGKGSPESGSGELAQVRFPDSYRYSAGFDLPTFGWVTTDARGVDSVLGINASLGISYKKYFESAIADRFNPAWGVGTLAIALPYATIGGDYQWTSGWYLGGHVGGMIFFYDDVFPFPIGYVSVGYRW
ncbi:hypothetical protein LKK83_31315 [Phormidium sp. CCY1219]|nr:hypothetical protein [Phormidium sp. CCY1219]